MSRTQIYLGDDERALLDRMSKATGASASELIRRAIRSTYRLELTTEEKLRLLESSAGSWRIVTSPVPSTWMRFAAAT